jgi:hypothetical protein
MCHMSPCLLYPSTPGQATNSCDPTQLTQPSIPLAMTSMQSHYEESARDSSKPSKPTSKHTMRWKKDLVTNCGALAIKSPCTSKHMSKPLKGILKTCNSQTSSGQLEQASTSQPNGSSDLTVATLHASPPMTGQKIPLTLFLFTPPLSHQMTHHLDPYLIGSKGCLWDLMPTFCNWLNVQGAWRTGALQLTCSDTMNMTMNTTSSTQKYTSSSWTSPPLSKIVPCMSNGSKHHSAQKVSLTLKGWVPMPPVPSGAHASLTMRRMLMKDQAHTLIISKPGLFPHSPLVEHSWT